MKKILLILFLSIALFSCPAFAAFEYTENFDGATLPSGITKVNSGSYTGTANVSDGNLSLVPGGSVSGVGIKNESTWKHLKFVATPDPNSNTGGYKYSNFGISNTDNVTTAGTSGWNTYLNNGTYVVIQGGTTTTTLVLTEAYYSGGTRYTKAETAVTLPTVFNNQSVIFDLVIGENGNASVYTDGTLRATMPVNTTGGGILIHQGAYTTPVPILHINTLMLSSTANIVLPTPVIAWSTPDEITTTQYDDAPTFSYSTTQLLNYTVYRNGSSVGSGSASSVNYSPEKTVYGDYAINFTVQNSSSMLNPETHNYIWHYMAAPDEAPLLTNFIPVSDQNIYQYESVEFSTNIDGSSGYPVVSNISWYVNGSSVQTHTDVVSDSYTYNGSTVGDFNITAVASNAQGTTTETKIVSVIPNSITFSNFSYYPLGNERGTVITFSVSDLTAGLLIHGWSPIFNETASGLLYTWTYENETIIDSHIASSDNETITFNSTVVPTGNYRIGVVGAPTAAYTYLFTMNGSYPVVYYTDQSTGGISSWLWDLGDSSSSPLRNPSHEYAAEGEYTTNLTSTNPLGSDSEIKTINLSSSLLPVANFTSNGSTFFAPLTVQFNDTSTGAVTSFEWDFDNDSIVDSTLQDPVYTYDTAGTYTVNLKCYNEYGYLTESKTDYLTVLEAANFTADPVSGDETLLVNFSCLNDNVDLIAWDFENDGFPDSSDLNPTWNYTTDGTYSVNMTITNEFGTTSCLKQNYIYVSQRYVSPLTRLIWFIRSLIRW